MLQKTHRNTDCQQVIKLLFRLLFLWIYKYHFKFVSDTSIKSAKQTNKNNFENILLVHMESSNATCYSFSFLIPPLFLHSSKKAWTRKRNGCIKKQDTVLYFCSIWIKTNKTVIVTGKFTEFVWETITLYRGLSLSLIAIYIYI